MNRLLIYICFFILPVTVSAQELSKDLESYQVAVAGDQIVVSGFKPASKGTVFMAYLCDKNLAVTNQYTKTLPASANTFTFSKTSNIFVFTFYGSGEKEIYRIGLDAGFLEKTAVEPLPKTKKIVDDNVLINEDWTYEPGFNENYVIGDLLLANEMTSITCYTVDDAVMGKYKMKWEKGFSTEQYVKMELLTVQDNVAYYFAAQAIPENAQKVIALNMDNGSVLFTTVLNQEDSLDAVAVSSIYIKDQTIFLAGTYIAHEDGVAFRVTKFGESIGRGYEDNAPLILAPTDGYYVMTLDAKSGNIQKMKTYHHPFIDKTVDDRDYRLAVCHSIQPLANGKMMAFFELMSSPHKSGLPVGTGFSGGISSELNMNSDGLSPKDVIWETDAFISLEFSADMSDFAAPSLLKWEEETRNYNLLEYDLFSPALRKEMPHDYCTLGEDGCYPQNFVCDGSTWIYHIPADGDADSDYLVKCNETEEKFIKLLPPGLILLRDNHTAIQMKATGDNSVKLKIVAIN